MTSSLVKNVYVFLLILKFTLTKTQTTLDPEMNEEGSSLPSEKKSMDGEFYDPCTDLIWPGVPNPPIIGHSNWILYEDEKCLKVSSVEAKTYAQAKAFCRQIKADLVSIDYLGKQKFLENLLVSQNISTGIWIGLSFKGKGKYEWADGSDYLYNNWASGSPKNKDDYCVQMSGAKGSVGKWSDVICTSQNMVVCEKIQTLSLQSLHAKIMKLRKKPLPVGFIYVQLPKENPPTEIWPFLTWKDVSADYAGVFFRVSGGNSAAFNSVQADNAPRVVGVDYSFVEKKYCGVYENNPYQNNINLRVNSKSAWIRIGDDPCNKYRGYFSALSFRTSGGEVRPINMAVKVWKRIG